MDTKTFRGRTIQDAVNAAKIAFGDDAVIVSTKQSLAGAEITAHAPYKLTRPVSDASAFRTTSWSAAHIPAARPAEPAAPALRAPAPAAPRAASPRAAATPEVQLPIRRSVDAGPVPSRREPAPAPTKPVAPAPNVNAELAAIKSMLSGLVEAKAPKPVPAPVPATPEPADPMVELLIACDVQPPAPRPARMHKRTDVKVAAASEIAGKLPSIDLLAKLTGPIALIGPAGAGKTTLAAKLGSILKIVHARDVSFINLDSNRIATELAPYAEALEAPITTPEPGADLTELFTDPHTTDPHTIDPGTTPAAPILIDTPGFAPGDTQAMRELCARLAHIPNLRTIVVLPATMGESAARRWGEVLSLFAPMATVLTNMDGAGTLGHWTRCKPTGAPIGATSSGPRVPEGVDFCSALSFANAIVESSKYGTPVASPAPSASVAR